MAYSLDMLCAPEMAQITGSVIVNLLTKEAGRSLPSKGIVAGQSVTSALLQLCNQPGVVYNDIDIFGSEDLWKHEPIVAPKRDIVSYAGRNFSTEVFEPGSGEVDDFRGYSAFSEKVEQTLAIQKVSRDSDFNYIWAWSNALQKGHARFASVRASNVLQSFDINSVKAAVDLETQTFFCTESFKQWAKTRQLKIEFLHAGAQTLVRYLEKSALAGNYANIELELAKCFSFVAAALLVNYQEAWQPGYKQTNGQKKFSAEMSNWHKQIGGTLCDEKRPHQAILSENLRLTSVDAWQKALDIIRSAPIPEKLKYLKPGRNEGISLLGAKYAGRSSRHERFSEYFDLVPVENCFLVVPKKLPNEVIKNPSAFGLFARFSGRGFFNSHFSQTCPSLLADPTVPKSQRNALASLYELSFEQSEWIQAKAYRELNRQKMVPDEWLIGAKDAVNAKHMAVFSAHREELQVLISAKNLREFAWACKQMVINVEKVFAQESHLFYATLARLRTAYAEYQVQQARQQGQGNFLAAEAYAYHRRPLNTPTDTEVLAFANFEKLGLKARVSLEFVEYCLAVHLRMRKDAAVYAGKQLIAPIDKQFYPVQDLERLDVVVQELITPQQLEDEGLRMHHCVGGYDGNVSKGVSRIFSLNLGNGRAYSTLEIRPVVLENSGEKAFLEIQNRASHNKVPENELKEAAKLLVKSFNDQKVAQKI